MSMGPAFDENITFLYVSDMEASATFYADVVGLDLVLVQPAGCRIYRASGTGYLGICKAAADRPVGSAAVGGDIVLCLVCQDVDAAYARISPKAACDGAPRNNPSFGIYHFYFTDPDGYVLEVQRFDDPTWKDAD